LLQEIKRTFECLDKKKYGKLSASEFVRGSKIMHATMTKEEAKAMIKEVDANGKYKKFIAVIDRLPVQFYLSMSM
jgi:Ca2+-binding EF-hand superfamily protein